MHGLYQVYFAGGSEEIETFAVGIFMWRFLPSPNLIVVILVETRKFSQIMNYS